MYSVDTSFQADNSLIPCYNGFIKKTLKITTINVMNPIDNWEL